MNEPLILIEPQGQAVAAFSRLKADRLHSEGAIRTALTQSGRRALWIAPSALAIQLLLSALPRRPVGDQRLLSLGEADGGRHGLLHVMFRFVISVDEGVRFAPIDELTTILSSPNRADLSIGVAFAPSDGALILYRGNFEPLVVPIAWFVARPDGPRPDISNLAVTDFCQTIRLGEYEAATDAVLYEFDEEFRRRAKKRQLAADRSFGGALRRLRLQKGLGRDDFPGLTAKEIARIERGEVKRPHPRTLAAIAKRLDVEVKAISTY